MAAPKIDPALMASVIRRTPLPCGMAFIYGGGYGNLSRSHGVREPLDCRHAGTMLGKLMVGASDAGGQPHRPHGDHQPPGGRPPASSRPHTSAGYQIVHGSRPHQAACSRQMRPSTVISTPSKTTKTIDQT